MKNFTNKIKLLIAGMILLTTNSLVAQNLNGGKHFNNLPGKDAAVNIRNKHSLNECLNTNSIFDNSRNLAKKTNKIRLDSTTEDKYNSISNNWENGTKVFYEYDLNGNITSEIDVLWNDTFSRWQNDSKTIHAYNSNGYKTLSEYYYGWNSLTNQWIGNDREIYNYDVDGNNTSIIAYTNPDGNQWIYNTKTLITFNSNHLRLSENYYSWNGLQNKWEDIANFKTEYIYDGNGHATQNKSSQWNTISNQWDNSYKDEYIYDTKGNNITYLAYSWNNNSWIPSYKNEYTFDPSNNITSRIYFGWNSSSSLWVASDKTTSGFEANGNLISGAYYSWNSILNQWDPTSKYSYNYDNSYTSNDIIWPFYNYFKHKLTSFSSQEYINNIWVNSEKGTAFYSPFNTTAIEESEIGETIIYPNPTNGILNIQLSQSKIDKITVFDISGKLVFASTQNEQSDRIKIDLSGLITGLYLIDIETENGQIIKQKFQLLN